MNHKKLYSVSSTFSHYYYIGWRYKDVPVVWVVQRRKEPIVDYCLGIKNYNPVGKYAKAMQDEFNEFFTYDEAMMLKEVLLKEGEDCEMQEHNLPIECQGMPVSGVFSDSTVMNFFPEGELLPFAVAYYTEREICKPDPEIDDIMICCVNIDQDNKKHRCLCCGEDVLLKSGYHYRVMANHYRYLSLVCDSCAKERVPLLYDGVLDFDKLPQKDDYLRNLDQRQKGNWSGVFKIKYRCQEADEQTKCFNCENEVKARHPYQIFYHPEVRIMEAVCDECVETYVPELAVIIGLVENVEEW